MINILLVVFIFLFVILWHEFGHFSIAKMVGVKVNEFSIGMGPRIFYKKRGDTEYSFRAIPVGGFVSMEGEEENSSDPRAFQNSSIIKRMAIVVAGATMNFILGFLVLLLLYIMRGVDVPKIKSFTPESNAPISGLEIGDRIIKMDSNIVNSWDDVLTLMSKNSGKNVKLQIEKKDGSVNIISIKPIEKEGRYMLGIYPDTEAIGILSAIQMSGYTFREMFMSLINFLQSIFRGGVKIKDISGPLGVVNVLVQAANQGIIQVLFWVAYININLGVINLLPLPALDGGKFIFLIVEALRGKPISPSKEGYVHLAGFILLMILLIVITFQDVLNLIGVK